MKKRIILFIAALVLVLSCAILPIFAAATDQTQGDFLYENRNKDYLLGELVDVTEYQLLPIADMIVNIADLVKPLASTHPSGSSGYFTNPFFTANYATIVYTNSNGRRVMLPLGTVNVSYTIDVTEGGVTTYAAYHLSYSFWDDEFNGTTAGYRLNYTFNPSSASYKVWDSSELGAMTNPEIYVFMGGASVGNTGLPNYDYAVTEVSGISPTYPYIAQGDYNAGYNNGLIEGSIAGRQEGYEEGKADGIVIGEQQGSNAWMNLKSLIFAIFDAPFYILSTAFNFELFGINVAGTILGLLTLAVIVFIAKIIIVRL